MDTLNMKENQLRKLKNRADDAYFNSGSPIMTDIEYDSLCQHLEKIETTQKTPVGCPPKTDDKIKLPIYMGSLTKCRDDKALSVFLDKFEHESFIIQEKLDGVSCLCLYAKREIRLYTRGDGTIGTDITRLLNYGLKIPSLNQVTESFMIRGELIINKKIFDSKYTRAFKNIRNMVSGQISKKMPDRTIVSDLEFVAYEVITATKYQKPLSIQYQFLKDLNFKVVYNRSVNRYFIQQEVLADYLTRRKKKSDYQIDGLVVTTTNKYILNDSDNPKYSFAFKIQGETVEVEVDHVKWNLSKSGKYKPQIFIQPVELCGVTISSLTGFNAKYIVTNKISCGSSLLITRSGDVIPHIVAILKEGDGHLKLPEQSRWNSVELYHAFETSPSEVIIKQMVYFFSSLKCLNCKDKTILKIYNAGYTTIESIIEAKIDNLSKIDGIGFKLSSKLLTSIKTNVRDASVHELLAALNSFGEGIGLKKIQNIDLNNPTDLTIRGLSEATIMEKILPVWDTSLTRVWNIKKMVGISQLPSPSEQAPHPLRWVKAHEAALLNKIFVFTGFRDSALEKQIMDLGGKVTSAISGKTTDLVVASRNDATTKLLKAKNLGIAITTKEELMIKVDCWKKQEQEIKMEVVYSSSYSSSDEE
jgi:DNA ligase (NAD+)